MGSFSWLKADKEDSVKNIPCGYEFKFLIPQQFGGGDIVDIYQDYGLLGNKEDDSPLYDMYELLAFWNEPNKVKFNGHFPLLKEIDEFTDYNREIGIDIGCYDEEIDNLKFPLKLVSITCSKTYEEIDTPSYGDPEQGFCPLY